MSRHARPWLLPAFLALVFAWLTDCANAGRGIAATTPTRAFATHRTTTDQGAIEGIHAITRAPPRHDGGTASWSLSTGEDDDPDQFCLANRLFIDIEGTPYVPQDRTSQFVCHPYSSCTAYARGPPSA
jgi:hypothetical protein